MTALVSSDWAVVALSVAACTSSFLLIQPSRISPSTEITALRMAVRVPIGSLGRGGGGGHGQAGRSQARDNHRLELHHAIVALEAEILQRVGSMLRGIG